MEFDRPVDGGLGATPGGVEDEDKLRDDVVLGLRPEQQIRSGEPGGPAEGYSWSAPTQQRMVTGGGI